jgi:hypothetical protein
MDGFLATKRGSKLAGPETGEWREVLFRLCAIIDVDYHGSSEWVKNYLNSYLHSC